ncbi:hypothetical protein GTU79_27820 [Sodalis ligni]|uniref:hypothetical protein n=1 Tax=Sodalis ligni TaxID=2697027 RepID=UPI001BDDF211|nr:hypothetical protein [Sodalis ligni]QWA10916.1 hypothetical protein GTU79_27820 [Sodalis ligni]
MWVLVIKEPNSGKDVNKLHFQTSAKAESIDLSTAFSQVSNTTHKIPNGNVDLAGYLYALSTAGEMPSDKLIDELTRCNASVNQARENLRNGRPNIMSDLIKRPQLGREITFIRNLTICGYNSQSDETNYAASCYFSMGNCSEHSTHTSIIQSQKCQKDEVVKKYYSDDSEDTGHEWSESNNCVMDSWKYGPAVLKGDANLIAENATEECIVNKESGQKLLQNSDQLLKKLKVHEEKNGQNSKAGIEKKTAVQIVFWPEMSVINTRLEKSLNAKGFTTSQKELISINSQIRATGVLRSLAAAVGNEISIKEATSGCDEVIGAFNTRFRTGYLGQWHSK